MDNAGLTGVQQVELQEAIGASGVPVRVFDVCLATTSIVNASCDLYNGIDTTGALYISVQSSDPNWGASMGIRFPNGCFAMSTGTTAIVNFIREF